MSADLKGPLREPEPEEIADLVRAILDEDLGGAGDLTTDAVIPEALRSTGHLVARQPLVLAGLGIARRLFLALDPTLEFLGLRADGSVLDSGTRVATISGSSRAILRGERAALNVLMRMSGIATATRAAVKEVAGTGTWILDTRKTAPGLRRLDKYAVAAGGGTNHRSGLYDAIMIKDTHLGVARSIGAAVAAVLARGHSPEIVTVEVRSIGELEQAIESGAGRALLDNMDLTMMREAVRVNRDRVVLEASGGLRPGKLRPVAETGVNCLSLGWLTHSAPAADLAMEMERS